MATPDQPSVGKRTLTGMMWAYGSYVGGRLLVLVATAILARLLSPDDFGLVALALIFIELLQTVRDLGVTQALVIVDEDETDDHAETVFVFSIALGLGLSVLAAALSPLAAIFFDEPELIAMLSVLGLTFLIRSLGATHYALAQKRIDFRARTIAEFADVLVRGVASIAFAVAGFGAWSLVIGYVVGAATQTVAIWLLVRWRPRLRPRREHLRPLLSFGGRLTGVDILAAVNQNVDYVFIGRVLGPTQLGLYTLAYRLPDLLIKNLTVVASQVLFPAFAAVQRDALATAFLITVRYTVMITLPMSAALVILAEPLVLALFGPKWSDAVPAMQVLVIASLLPAITTPAGTAYKAMGRADILLKLGIWRTLMLVALVAAFVGEGIVAVAACLAVVVAVFFVVSMVIAGRMLDVHLPDLWTPIWPSLAATAAMSAAIWPIDVAIESSWLTIVAASVVGAAVYVAVLWLIVPDSIRELRDRLLARRAVPGAAA